MAAPSASAAPDAGAAPSDTAANAPAFPASSPENELTASLLRAFTAEKGNVFFSGASLRGALGMTALGAKGKTLDELAKTLSLDPDPAKNAAAAKAERAAWASAAGKAQLSIANRAWMARAFPIDKAYAAEVTDGYGTAPSTLDFVGAAEPSRQKINGWVSTATNGRIKDLLPSGSITSLTRLVLTNAVYFKGDWTEPFPKKDTKDEPFQLEAGPKNVPTMHRTGSMAYGETDDAQVVSLPYKDSTLAMVVVLPKRAGDLSAMLGKVSGGEIDAWIKKTSSARVVLSMPKFTYSWGRSVKNELMTLGIRSAFGDDADFTGIAPATKERLSISDVFHKAFVLVDETGTEAAAATGTVMVASAIHYEKQVVMKVDHPFLFFVVNAKTGDVLFAGKVADPKP